MLVRIQIPVHLYAMGWEFVHFLSRSCQTRPVRSGKGPNPVASIWDANLFVLFVEVVGQGLTKVIATWG